MVQGPDYGHKLTGSIEEIQSHGNKLKSEGEKAAMHRQHATLEELMKKSDAILAVALANADKEEKNQQLMDERTSRMLNHLLDLLQVEEDRHKQRIKEMEEMERKRSEEVNYLLGQLRGKRAYITQQGHATHHYLPIFQMKDNCVTPQAHSHFLQYHHGYFWRPKACQPTPLRSSRRSYPLFRGSQSQSRLPKCQLRGYTSKTRSPY